MSKLIQDQIYEIVVKYVKVVSEDLRMDTPLVEVGIDSLVATQIAFDVEDAMGIEIPDVAIIEDRFKVFRTMADIVRLVEHIQKSPTSPQQ